MISLEKYKQILGSGLLLDHYLVLCSVRDCVELPNNKRVDGFINLLNKKGYIEDGALTEKAFDIIDIQPMMIVGDRVVETPAFDYGSWVQTLYSECKDLLYSLTGKRQITAKINKTDRKGYPFMPNLADFSKKLFTVISQYKLKDMDLVKDTILNHIQNCYNSNTWFPLMKYYISKDGSSDMVTEMESAPETSDSVKSSRQRFV